MFDWPDITAEALSNQPDSRFVANDDTLPVKELILKKLAESPTSLDGFVDILYPMLPKSSIAASLMRLKIDNLIVYNSSKDTWSLKPSPLITDNQSEPNQPETHNPEIQC
jgi:hypothetical protein